ncbi:unnamed protein product [Heligmosomoides polygyrus]|uniref:DUF5641 domain-containing protein n=1 Tax=Heligmosomoides polygyrus TaxID=6339 RepID=A0A183GA05_HELPZ|nr:unnamed protein product [Heligmosomoides polygyrus]
MVVLCPVTDREVNMVIELAPELGRRKRAACVVFKSAKEGVRKTKNIWVTQRQLLPPAQVFTRTMSTVSACKANLTKSIKTLEFARDPQPESEYLEHLKYTVQAHMAELRAAVRTVKDRQQAFLTLVCNSSSPEVDNEAYANYMEGMKLEETLLSTEAVITTLRIGLGDVSTEQPPYNGYDTDAQILGSSEIARSKETKELQLAEQGNSYFTRTTIPSQNDEGTPTSQVRPLIRLGILQGLHKFEDFHIVLPILDLVKGKFPSEVLHDLELQAGTDFDLVQVMHHLDNITVSREKYEDSTTLCHRDSNAGVSEVVTHATTVPIQSADDVEETTTKCYARIGHAEANLPRIEIVPGRASDNAPTFHGTEATVQKIIYFPANWNKISDLVVRHRIEWRFITLLSPWKGGFYEWLVALFKSAFQKSVGRSLLPLETLQTTVVEIEAIINTCPITPFRESDTFAHTLKLAHFISPEVNIQLQVIDRFWDLWRSDYLAALKERQQLRIRQPRSANITPGVGDVVIMGDDNTPRGLWPLAVITKLNYAPDKVAISAVVRTTNGKFLTGSITQLYPLELAAPQALEPNNNDTSKEKPALEQNGCSLDAPQRQHIGSS